MEEGSWFRFGPDCAQKSAVWKGSLLAFGCDCLVLDSDDPRWQTENEVRIPHCMRYFSYHSYTRWQTSSRSGINSGYRSAAASRTSRSKSRGKIGELMIVESKGRSMISDAMPSVTVTLLAPSAPSSNLPHSGTLQSKGDFAHCQRAVQQLQAGLVRQTLLRFAAKSVSELI